jgi:hypothetical protein
VTGDESGSGIPLKSDESVQIQIRHPLDAMAQEKLADNLPMVCIE